MNPLIRAAAERRLEELVRELTAMAHDEVRSRPLAQVLAALALALLTDTLGRVHEPAAPAGVIGRPLPEGSAQES